MKGTRRLERLADRLLGIDEAPKMQKRWSGPRIGRMSYRTYMRSRHWRRRKKQYFGKHGKRCAVCPQSSGVTFHHKRYHPKEYGREPDRALVALCPRHHKEFHEQFGVAADVAADTDLYVKHSRQIAEFERAANHALL